MPGSSLDLSGPNRAFWCCVWRFDRCVRSLAQSRVYDRAFQLMLLRALPQKVGRKLFVFVSVLRALALVLAQVEQQLTEKWKTEK